MKKTYNFLMSVAVAAMAFIGCTNTEISIDNNPAPAPVDGVYRQLTFAADTESDASRTHHTGETVHWSKGDRIRIGYTRDGVWQNAEGRTADSSGKAKLYASTEQDSDAELSVFRVTQLFKDTEATGELWFYGLYPSEITKRNEPDFSNSETGEINVYIPWIQAPTATSFDPKADLLVSKSRHSYESFPSYDEHIKMVWTRLVAHGQITLKNLLDAGMVEGEKISFVEFTVDNTLTGDFTLNIAGQTITSKSGSNNKVRLSFAENTEYNTLIDADNDGTEDDFVVWFATAPFTTVSLNVKVGTDKAIYTRSIANANKTFKVNTRSTLGINMASATRSDLELGESWELMTDASVLAEGKKIVIAAADYDVAMSTTQNTNNRAETAITKSETKNTITIDSDVQVLTVGKGTTDGTWSLYDEDKTGYLYAASTGSNYLKTKTALDATGSWTIEVTSAGIATVKSAGRSDTQPGTMRYNATNSPPIFSCYKASNQMKDISIYHNATALKQLAKPVISRLTEVEAKAVLVEWGEVENALYYSIKCQKDGTTTNKGIVIFKNITDTSFVADNLSDGTWNITVTAYGDGYYSNTSDSASITVTGVTPTVEANPTELTFTSAGGTQTIEVNCNNLGDNVEITAESSNDAFEVSVEDGIVTVTAGANATGTEISGTITITANGTTTVATSVAVKQEAMVEASTEWQLLTDLRSLQADGLEVIIASANSDTDGNDFAMSTTQNSNNRGQDAITKSDDKNTLSVVGANVQIFQLKQGTTEGTWAFFDETYNENEGGYLYAAGTSTQNYLRTQATNDANGSWTITVTDGVALIVAEGASGHNVLRYNSGSDLFSCYESESSVQPVALYFRKASTEPRILTLNMKDNNTTFKYDGSTELTAIVTTKNASAETLTATLTNASGEEITDTATVGNDEYVEITVRAATNTTNESRTLTLTVSLTNGSSKSITLTQEAAPVATSGWSLLTDVADLKPGMEVVFTSNAAASPRVLGGTLTSGYFEAVEDITFSDNKSTITALPTDAIIFTIGGSTNAYTFTCESGMLGATEAKKVGFNSGTTTWTIAIDANYNATIQNTTSEYGHFMHNVNSPRFTTYTSDPNVSMLLPQIYYRGEGSGEFPAAPKTPVLSVNPTTLSFEAAGGDKAITCTIENEVSGVNVTASENVDWLSTSVSGKTVTVTATANSSTSERTATVTVSYDGATSQTVTVTQAGATQSGDETTVTDYIDAPLTGATGTSYITWSGKTSNSSAVYAGKSATKSKNQEYVQLNSSNPNGIITTASGGKVSKIIVTWDASTTDGRTLDIYGKNEAYTSSSELYDSSKQGTKLGSIVEATSTELTIDGDYSYIGLRSKSGAMYITQIQIVWVTSGNAGGGDTPATPTKLQTPTVTATASGNTVNVSWGEISGAANYTVKCGTTTKTATGTSTSFMGLAYSTDYEVSVVANPSDEATHIASDAGTDSVTTEADPNAGGGSGSEPTTVTMSSFTATNASMDSNISYSTAKGGGTANPAANSGQIRLYQNSAGTGGGTITITAANGATLSSVTIGSAMATSIAYTIDSSTTKSATASLAQNGKYTVNDINATSITFYCMGTTSSTRLYVNYLSVTYNN